MTNICKHHLLLLQINPPMALMTRLLTTKCARSCQVSSFKPNLSKLFAFLSVSCDIHFTDMLISLVQRLTPLYDLFQLGKFTFEFPFATEWHLTLRCIVVSWINVFYVDQLLILVLWKAFSVALNLFTYLNTTQWNNTFYLLIFVSNDSSYLPSTTVLFYSMNEVLSLSFKFVNKWK